MPDATHRHVFVYGTLRRGEANDINRLVPAPEWVGPAEVAGALYDLGSYPGVILGDAVNAGAGLPTVRGEVYRITPALESLLDRIEEVAPQPSGEYIRREIPVSVQGATVVCLVYELAPDRAAGCALIASGDWVEWCKRRVRNRKG